MVWPVPWGRNKELTSQKYPSVGSVSFLVSGGGMGYLLSVNETSGEEDTAMKGMLVIDSLPQAFEVLGEMGLVVKSGRGNVGKLIVRRFKGILEGRMKSRLIGGLRRFVLVGVWIVAMGVFPGTY